MSNMNLSIISGTLAVDAELKTFESGAEVIRYLVTVKVDTPRKRVDVIPVTYWPEKGLLGEPEGKQGDQIWVTGSIQRRYWESSDGRRSRLELVAEQVVVKTNDGQITKREITPTS